MAGVEQVCIELGVPMDAQLFELARTHRSYAYENGGLPTNERLEFLGDSVLGLVVTEHLYSIHPELSEGELAKLRAAVVNARALAGVARRLNIGPLIRLGRGEISTGGQDKSSILADCMEALIGACFITHGIEGARVLVHRLFDPLIERAAQLGAGLDWKTSLQELAAEQGLGSPRYEIEESGPDHDKRFSAWAVVGPHRHGPGTGRNKKTAEQEAAGAAFAALSLMYAEANPDDDYVDGVSAGHHARTP
jgi:ribonuclease III